MNLSLSITSYNRCEMTIESFINVIDDDRLNDIVILDDCSTDGSYEKLRDHFKDNKKVRVIRQAQNRGMSLNKRDAISLAKNEWVIILDSDNVITSKYIDGFEVYIELYKNGETIETSILCPDYASPSFDYRKFSNRLFDKKNIRELASDSIGGAFLNTCNYVVHRETYLQVYEHNEDMKGTDTIWFAYLWLKAGHSFLVCRNMHYMHRAHDGSGFLQDADYNMKKATEVRKLIMQL